MVYGISINYLTILRESFSFQYYTLTVFWTKNVYEHTWRQIYIRCWGIIWLKWITMSGLFYRENAIAIVKCVWNYQVSVELIGYFGWFYLYLSVKILSLSTFNLLFRVPTNGYYFFVFNSENEIQPNYLRVRFDLLKTLYNISNPVHACKNSTTECSLPFKIFSNERTVLELPLSGNDSQWNEEYVVVSTCEPRTSIYLLCIIAVPLLILIFAFHWQHDESVWGKDSIVILRREQPLKMLACKYIVSLKANRNMRTDPCYNGNNATVFFSFHPII